MKSFRYFVCILIFCFGPDTKAQNQGNIWVFGQNAGLDFNYFPSQPFELPSFPYKKWADGGSYSNQFFRGLSPLSDTNGNLLYFAEGSQAWNKQFTFLLNGDSLLGPSQHPALFIPSLQKDHVFLIESHRSYSNIKRNSGAFFSIINQKLDNGLGCVGLKNRSIGDSLLALFDGVYLGNSDTVVMAYLKGNSQEIKFFKTITNGLEEMASFNTGRFFKLANINTLEQTEYGQLKFTLDGKKLAVMTSINKEILLIDLGNGPHNAFVQTVISTPLGGLGIEFSPNGELLYYSDGNNVYQINTGNLVDTFYELGSITNTLNQTQENGDFGMLQLAPDGSILIARARNPQNKLDRIRFPNQLAPNCADEKNSVSLGQATSNHYLPSLFGGYINHPKLLHQTTCFGDSSLFRAAFIPTDSLFWDFGDGTNQISTIPEVQHYYLSDGDFKVSLFYKNNQNEWDTLSKTITIHPKYDLIPVLSDLICETDSIILNVQIPNGIAYEWSTGEQTDKITVHQGGTYYVEARDQYCTNFDSIRIDQIACDITIPVFCESDSASINVPQFDSDSIAVGIDSFDFIIKPQTIPFIFLVPSHSLDSISFTFYKNGDSIIKSHDIDYRKKLLPNLPTDTLFCSGQLAVVDATMNGINNYEWSPVKQNTPILSTVNSGIYFLTYGDGVCQWTDSINIHIFPCRLGSQTLCSSVETTLSLDSVTVDSVWWDFGNGTQLWTKQSYVNTTYTSSGTYLLTIDVYINGVSKSFQEAIRVNATPKIFTKDTLNLCFEDTLLIPNLSADLFEFEWHDGSTHNYYMPTADQLVWVGVNDSFCSALDSLYLVLKDCDCLKYLPNAFSPNEDGLNELFSLTGNCGINRFSIRIYSRWGEKVFESYDPNFQWNGTYKGKALPEGVYIWTISGLSVDSGQLLNTKGVVHLLR